jgi:hypothetical protein
VGAENGDAKTALKPSVNHGTWGRGEGGERLLARPIAVDGMGEENTGADDAEQRGDCIQHGNDS